MPELGKPVVEHERSGLDRTLIDTSQGSPRGPDGVTFPVAGKISRRWNSANRRRSRRNPLQRIRLPTNQGDLAYSFVVVTQEIHDRQCNPVRLPRGSIATKSCPSPALHRPSPPARPDADQHLPCSPCHLLLLYLAPAQISDAQPRSLPGTPTKDSLP